MKAASKKIYEDVVKAPIAKTQHWMQKKTERILNAPLPNVGPIPLGPKMNMAVRDGSDAAKDSFDKIVRDKESGMEWPEDRNILKIKNPGQYFAYINEIGKRDDLTTEEKFKKIHEAYNALEQKGDVTVVADMKFLKPEGFGSHGRMLVDWPDKMGFDIDSVQTIDRDNPLLESWDRIGGKGGENFTILPKTGTPYTYNERAIPYIENPHARHIGTLNNKTYFESIDAIRSENFEELNRIATVNGKEQISYADFLDFKAHYDDFQENIQRSMGDVDANYGLKGKAAPWINSSTGERLMEGGAEQIVTPLSAEMLEIIGVIPKY